MPSDGTGFIWISGLLTQGTLVIEPSKNELSAFFSDISWLKQNRWK